MRKYLFVFLCVASMDAMSKIERIYFPLLGEALVGSLVINKLNKSIDLDDINGVQPEEVKVITSYLKALSTNNTKKSLDFLDDSDGSRGRMEKRIKSPLKHNVYSDVESINIHNILHFGEKRYLEVDLILKDNREVSLPFGVACRKSCLITDFFRGLDRNGDFYTQIAGIYWKKKNIAINLSQYDLLGANKRTNETKFYLKKSVKLKSASNLIFDYSKSPEKISNEVFYKNFNSGFYQVNKTGIISLGPNKVSKIYGKGVGKCIAEFDANNGFNKISLCEFGVTKKVLPIEYKYKNKKYYLLSMQKLSREMTFLAEHFDFPQISSHIVKNGIK